MSEQETTRGVSTPSWDGEASSAANYMFKVTAVAGYHSCLEAMDSGDMTDCPTKSEYDTLMANTNRDADEDNKVFLFKANRKIMAIISLGQNSDLGMAMVNHTKTPDQPNGVAHEFLAAMMEEYTPNDCAAEIKLDADLNKIKFVDAKEYYKDVVSVTSRYRAKKTQKELVKILSTKVTEVSFMMLVVDHLKGATHNLKRLCDEINEVQSLLKVGEPAKKAHGKEVQLANQQQHAGPKKCFSCNSTDHLNKDCPNKKKKSGGSGSGGGGGNASQPCNHCGTKGHKEAKCFVKNPELAPDWYKEIQASKKAKKAKEASGASLEIEMMLANVGAEGTERYSPVTMQQLDALSAIKDVTEASESQDFADARL